MNENAEFDVIIYGASGFTGRLVAEYMAAQWQNTELGDGRARWRQAGCCAR